LGCLEDDCLSLEEVYRFPNGPVRVQGHLHWDVLRIWSEIQHGLRLAAAHGGLSSLGVDTWGVDFGLLDDAGNLIGNPYHYRDSRTDGMMEAAFARMPRQEIYRQTGIQFMQLNSLYQLLSMRLQNDPALECAASLLTMPDLFNYWLTGRKANEFTIATTTQCYNPITADWAWEVLRRLEIPASLFQPIIQPGSILGEINADTAQEAGLAGLQVVAVGSHDTASAVAAVPAESGRIVFISSGTWSLVGSETPKPVISERSLAFNFTNEGGIGGTFRFLKNISGLWLVQECRRAWAAAGQEFSYAELTRLAAEAPAFHSLVDPNDAAFLSPGEMPERIGRYCLKRGQPPPTGAGQFVRCALESLALAYRKAIEELEQALGYTLEAIHIVGGGSQNRLLNQFAADATGKPVIAGPVEATAIGNVLVQAMAMGQLSSLAEARQLVRRSFPVEVFEPARREAWDEAYQRWRNYA
jgi:sugar (pentulose or hexulose) kinase